MYKSSNYISSHPAQAFPLSIELILPLDMVVLTLLLDF